MAHKYAPRAKHQVFVTDVALKQPKPMQRNASSIPEKGRFSFSFLSMPPWRIALSQLHLVLLEYSISPSAKQSESSPNASFDFKLVFPASSWPVACK